MEHERFDALVRGLGQGASRRRALGLLAGMAGLGLGEAAAKKGKVDICHHDRDSDTWHPISVPRKTADKHIDKHGDFEFGDNAASACCTDCGEGETCVITVDANGTGSGSCVCNDPRDACESIKNCAGGACFCNFNAVGGGTSCNGLGRCTDKCEDCRPDQRCVVAKGGEVPGGCCPTGFMCVDECASSAAGARHAGGERQLVD